MKISVRGMRASPSDWEAVSDIPKEQLHLTSQQRATASELRIPEEDYARSALAGKRTQEKLLAKTKQFARILENKMKDRGDQATVQHVALDTWDGKFDVQLEMNGSAVALSIDEEIVDELLERGSPDAEQRLTRIMDRAMQK